MQRGDALQIGPWDRREERRGAGRDHQSVVVNDTDLAARQVAAGDGLGRAIDGERLGRHHCLDPLGLVEEIGIPHDPGRRTDQQIAIVEDTADIVGIAAGGHRQVGILLDERDDGLFIEATRPGGRLGSSGRTADDDDLEWLG